MNTRGPWLDLSPFTPPTPPAPLGYMACIDWGPGWHRYLLIDRQTRKHYIRTTGPRTTVREIDRHAAKRAYHAAGKPALRPVLH